MHRLKNTHLKIPGALPYPIYAQKIINLNK